MYTVETFDNPKDFCQVTESYLLEQEAANNLILGLSALLCRPHSERGTPVLRVIKQNGQVIGAALRSGENRALLLTSLPEDAVPPLYGSLQEVVPEVTKVLGPKTTVDAFVRASGRNAEQKMGLGIYQCTKVVRSKKPVTGHFRSAVISDLDLLVVWSEEFALDAHLQSQPYSEDNKLRTRSILDKRIKDGNIVLWCDPEPVSQTYITTPTPNGIRITGVFTPRNLRGKGYASACVRELTTRLLQNCKFVFLFTDLANPTSNSIYQQVGYEYVDSYIDVNLLK